MNISKTTFCEAIKNLKKVFDYDNAMQALNTQYNYESPVETATNELITTITTLLEEATNDKEEWIAYYCWELNFGEEYYDGVVIDKDGSSIPLSTPEQLYDLLLSYNNKP